MKKRCLRMLAGFIVLVMLVTMMGGAMAAGPELHDLDLKMLAAGPDTTDGWWKDHVVKTALAVSAYCDVQLADNASWHKIIDEAVSAGKMYVAKTTLSDEVLLILYYGERDLLSVFFTPSRKRANVVVVEISAGTVEEDLASLMEDGTISAYTEIEFWDFYRSFKALVDVMSEE